MRLRYCLRAILLLLVPTLTACGDGNGPPSSDAGPADMNVAVDLGPVDQGCASGAERSGTTACGFNDRGTLIQVCVSGAWQDGTDCVDADVCVDGTERPGTTACGMGDVGALLDRCVSGAWQATSDCSCGDVVAPQADYSIGNATDIAALAGVTQITGRLRISGATTAGDLAGLESLRCVGSLEIRGTSITSFNGLDNLTHVATYGSISETGAANMTGLGGLRSFGEDLAITGNEFMVDLEGLGSPLDLRLGLQIEDQTIMTSLRGLEGLTALYGSSNSISNNPALASLTGLDNLAVIRPEMGGSGARLAISNNGMLTDLTGLGGLSDLQGTLDIDSNPMMTSYAGIGLVTSANGRIELESPNMLAFAGFDELVEIGSLQVFGSMMTTMAGSFPKLESTTGDISVFAPALTGSVGMAALETVGGNLELQLTIAPTITGLDALTTVTGQLIITRSDVLTSLAGLGGITSLGGLTINQCDEITTLDGLGDGTPFTAFTGDLNTNNNVKLADLGAVGGLVTVAGDVSFRGDSALTDFADLANLQTVGGALRITGHSMVQNLTGLSMLESAGSVSIGGNGVLTSVAELSSLTTVTGSFFITNNPMLSECDVLTLFDSVTSGSETQFGNLTCI